ncbi:hypothetical protein L1987_36874 [Smallanthus sonchifolius]|uniref:Uncharacterized protein n=1 Tax=Smallanthus sonchifolius TaxID=185202 RepID=A0ACB9HG55_9ASTR|nr:hypothetical protein L1987_36874 [Smallanthus sonchifolius]
MLDLVSRLHIYSTSNHPVIADFDYMFSYAHCQRVINWINATGGTSSTFDVTTKMDYFILHCITSIGMGHWTFPRDKLMQGYAYILTHPRTGGIYCRRPVKIYYGGMNGSNWFVADCTLVMGSKI